MQYPSDAFNDYSKPLNLDPCGYFARFLLERRRDGYEVTHQAARGDVCSEEQDEHLRSLAVWSDEISKIVGREANDRAVTLHSVR